jgi:3-oxoacyl-[acyl-carrier protein] reductase
VLAVDLDSVFLMTSAAAPHIVAAGGGSMVCLGGSPSHLGTRGRSHVCAAKMGVVGLARVLANELGEHGINVNVVAPGHVDTTRGKSAGQSSSVSSERAMARKAQPEEIAAMVCHLCLPAGRYVTGQTIHVNGGMLFAGA